MRKFDLESGLSDLFERPNMTSILNEMIIYYLDKRIYTFWV